VTVATGTTFTINGPIDAGLYQVFSCTGTGAVAGLKIVNAVWFGAIGDGSTDNAVPFQKASAALVAGGELYIPPAASTYKFSTGFAITVDRPVMDIQGSLVYTGSSGAAVTLGPGAAGGYIEYANVNIKSLTQLTQDWSSASIGLRLDGTRACYVNLREVANFTSNIQLYSTNLNNNYHNEFHIGYSRNAKIHVDFAGGEGRMNRNIWVGPHCKDSGVAPSYTGSYGIYIPRGAASQTKGNRFYGLSFEWNTARLITNNIYCGGDYNYFDGLSLADGIASDVSIRFHASSEGNTLILPYSTMDGGLYDPSYNTAVYAMDMLRVNQVKFSRKATFNANYQVYKAGDRWLNSSYDEQRDSPGKICITKGSYFPATAKTATTNIGSGTVTISASPTDIYVGAIIDIAGVTGPLEVTARDCVASTITVSPVADATVAGAAITFTSPTFADETPASLRGYKTWNPGNVAVGSSTTTTTTVTGAAVGDMVIVGPGVDTQGLTPFAYVNNTDTVTIGLANNTAGAVDLGNSTWYVRVFKY
jgi:hypothetical protein